MTQFKIGDEVLICYPEVKLIELAIVVKATYTSVYQNEVIKIKSADGHIRPVLVDRCVLATDLAKLLCLEDTCDI